VSESVVVGLAVQVLGLQDHTVAVEYQNFETFRRSGGRGRNRKRFLGGKGSFSNGSEAKSGDAAERVIRRRSKKAWGRREPYRARHGRLAVWLWALPVVLTDLTTVMNLLILDCSLFYTPSRRNTVKNTSKKSRYL
jgi:hypothetical protein